MILIDTNIFLELLLGQEKADDCRRLLNKISKGSIEAVVSRFSLHAIEAALEEPKNVASFLRSVESSIGLLVYDTSTTDELAASLIQTRNVLDFDDALQYYVAKKLGASSLVSFDRHFDNLDISRSTPDQF